jgi:hypothetical protein
VKQDKSVGIRRCLLCKVREVDEAVGQRRSKYRQNHTEEKYYIISGSDVDILG